MPTVGAVVIKVVVPDLVDNRVVPELATSANSILVVLGVGVLTLACATRVYNVIGG